MKKNCFLLTVFGIILIISATFADSFIFKSSPKTKEILKKECSKIVLIVDRLQEILASGHPTEPFTKVLKAISDLTDWIKEWIVVIAALSLDLDKEDGK